MCRALYSVSMLRGFRARSKSDVAGCLAVSVGLWLKRQDLSRAIMSGEQIGTDRELLQEELQAPMRGPRVF